MADSNSTAHAQEDSQETLQLLREELQRNGFVKIPRSIFCLDEATIETLRTRFENLFKGKFETGLYPDEIHWRQGISREDATREICNAWKSDGEIFKVVGSPQVGKLACDLMQWESSRIGQDDVLHKPPQGGKPVGFHQDAAYISDNFIPRQDNCLTMWIALDDADQETGALQYAPGSHKWQYPQQQQQQQHHTKDSNLSFHVPAGQDYLTPLRHAAARAKMDPEMAVASIQTIPVPAGEMVVHHQDIWHGSGPNVSSTRCRRSLVAHILSGNVQWQTNPLPHYIYGRYYIRGETIPREDFFPTTYSTANPID